MARSTRDRFERERDRIADIDDDDVRAALLDFADALDPEIPHVEIPVVKSGRLDGHESKSNSTAKGYLSALRCAHQRGLDLLGADAETVNRFMDDLVTEPDNRRYGLVGPPGPGAKETIGKPSAKQWQSALRAFYRFAAEPGVSDAEGRPEVAVAWDDVNGSRRIRMFTERSKPKHDESDMPGQDDLDAMREACLSGQNTRRDRAFVEVAAGTGQRVYALVTLLVGDVHLDGTDDDLPHVLLNPAIDGNGDKGAIENAGRMRPFVADPGPVKQWIQHHPLSDPEVRAEVGAPESFDDCYLFVGSLRQRSTDPTGHWGDDAARDMLNRRKADTASLPGVKTVEVPVNPHAWRAYAYTRSKDLPLDEDVRRKVFGWRKGSDTGDRVYGHKATEQAARQYVEAHREAFGDESGDVAGVAEAVVGEAVTADLSPEARKALVRELASDPAAMEELAAAIKTAAE